MLFGSPGCCGRLCVPFLLTKEGYLYRQDSFFFFGGEGVHTCLFRASGEYRGVENVHADFTPRVSRPSALIDVFYPVQRAEPSLYRIQLWPPETSAETWPRRFFPPFSAFC